MDTIDIVVVLTLVVMSLGAYLLLTWKPKKKKKIVGVPDDKFIGKKYIPKLERRDQGAKES